MLTLSVNNIKGTRAEIANQLSQLTKSILAGENLHELMKADISNDTFSNEMTEFFKEELLFLDENFLSNMYSANSIKHIVFNTKTKELDIVQDISEGEVHLFFTEPLHDDDVLIESGTYTKPKIELINDSLKQLCNKPHWVAFAEFHPERKKAICKALGLM